MQNESSARARFAPLLTVDTSSHITHPVVVLCVYTLEGFIPLTMLDTKLLTQNVLSASGICWLN
jgi:hypothetical protein